MPKGKPLSDVEKAKKLEEKAAKFKELGTKRLNKALGAMRMMIPLSNKAQYHYTPEQVEKMTAAMDEVIDAITAAYAGQKVSSGGVEL